jgi:hypothetical protein
MTTTTAAHHEIDEEFEKSLEDGIEDEAVLENLGAPQFSITSYGADYTVDSLVKRMRANSFIIPRFQRKFVWSQRHASKFIESLLMGLPVPGIFLYKQSETNTHLVIDGQQRLTSLRAFYDGTFGSKKFSLTGVREPWTNKSYSELETSDQLKIDDSIVHATIFQQDSPKDALNSIYFVFERINSGGISLSPQEIRNCINQGPLLDLIAELNQDANWREVFGPENNRLKDQELILRFLALNFSNDKYSRPMAGFLNKFAADNLKASQPKLDEYSRVFRDSIALVKVSIGAKAFRSIRALNAAVFDSVMVGLARRLSANNSAPKPEDIASAYTALLEDATYRAACERSTADEENVARRIQLATDAFAKT